VRRFEWEGAAPTSAAIRRWTEEAIPQTDVEVATIERAVRERGDEAVLELTARFDATEAAPQALRVDPAAGEEALRSLDPALREALEVASANIRAVAEAQLDAEARSVALPQGQRVVLREIPVSAAGLYAPGGRAVYPSSVLMCAVPARVAGVERLALASPPAPDGKLNPLILAAAALTGIDEIYAMGGAQAIFALAHGTQTIAPVDVVAGPGNAWVRAAKWAVSGTVGIDSLAGPSELMLIADDDTDPEWAALDLCAQAEHGYEGALLLVGQDGTLLDAVATATERAATERAEVENAPLALIEVPALDDAIALANAFAPEHLQLMARDGVELAGRITTAGCVFVGRFAATAFGDYVAGSNHVLPTAGAGRHSGPLGPDAFSRTMATVEVSGEAAAKLAPYVDTLARAEELPVHGESAMIRTRDPKTEDDDDQNRS
jgi:histidinol dehydrogenase